MQEKTRLKKIIERDGAVCGICGLPLADELELYKKYEEFNDAMKREKVKLQRAIREFRKKHVLINIDHIIPRSKGGANHMDNYQVTHIECNLAKGNKMDYELKKPIS